MALVYANILNFTNIDNVFQKLDKRIIIPDNTPNYEIKLIQDDFFKGLHIGIGRFTHWL